MSWVDPQTTLVYTGQAVTQEELDVASHQISAYSGRLEEEPEAAITALDRRWLAMATAYQAVWLKAKPGVLTHRESHTSTSSDGVQVSRESEAQIMLAPMAARCLRNLSTIGNRTTQALPALPPKGSILSERADPYHLWKDLPIS